MDYSRNEFAGVAERVPARDQGKMCEVACVDDRAQVEVQVTNVELFETVSDESDQGQG